MNYPHSEKVFVSQTCLQASLSLSGVVANIYLPERMEREPITGVWRQSPQRGPGAEPLVREAKPPLKLKAFWSLDVNGAGKFSPFPKVHLYFYSRCNGNDMGKIYVEIQGVR